MNILKRLKEITKNPDYQERLNQLKQFGRELGVSVTRIVNDGDNRSDETIIIERIHKVIPFYQKKSTVLYLILTLIIAPLIVGIILKYLPEKEKKDKINQNSSQQRPHLIPELIPNPPYFMVDGQSIMTFTLMKKSFLYARFRLKNTSNIPAINVRAKYDSPTQKNVYFDMGENVILPNSFSNRYWTPWINIQSEVNKQNKEPFDIILTIEYDGNNSQRYFSLFQLTVKKETNDKYKLIDEKVTFNVKED